MILILLSYDDLSCLVSLHDSSIYTRSYSIFVWVKAFVVGLSWLPILFHDVWIIRVITHDYTVSSDELPTFLS